jgi:hypothetical protein
MTVPHENEEQDKPLDPAVENVRRKLVRSIIINLSILFIALMAVVVALVYRATRVPSSSTPAVVSDLPVPESGEMLEGVIALPQGATIISHSLSGGVVSLQVQLSGGERSIFLYDIAAGRIVGRLAISDAQ